MHRRSRFGLARCLSLLLPAGLVVASVFAGCGSSGDDEAADEAAVCSSNSEFFRRQVWGQFMGSKCLKCHTPDGVAANEGKSKFVLQPTAYPGFLDVNMEMVRNIARTSVGGTSILLKKPLGEENHGGGQVLTADSPEYKALTEMVDRLVNNNDPCPQTTIATVEQRLPQVTLLDNAATLRKAAMVLAGRLPTDEEVAAAAAEGDAGKAGLEAGLDKLLTEDAFYERLREIYNDLLLTDKYLSYGGAAIDFMNTNDLYKAGAPYRSDNQPEDRYLVNEALAREPLNLISYVVRNDRPFTEILTANYALVNPYLAKFYGVDPGFSDPSNKNEFKEAQVTLATGVNIPHAGVLSTPAFLNRWNTTPTNRNRGRARRVYAFFMGTDLLKLAERPVDASKITMIDNPTMNAPTCQVCHRAMDPIAGGFRGYDDGDYEDFDPKREWHQDMFPPGYGETKLPPESYGNALQWEVQQLVQDPRFAIGSVEVIFTGITGHKVLHYPTDTTSADYAAKLGAWEAQDAFFRQVVEKFKAANYNLKVAIKEIVKSPYFRANGLSADMPAEQVPLLANLGLGRFLSPEILNQKINAVTGFKWRKRWEWEKEHDWLIEDYKIVYGGIDSDNSPIRLNEPNGIVANVGRRMANEVACYTTAYDFTKPKEQRRYFTKVEKNQAPLSAGSEVPGSVAAIKENIVYLHKLFLGETLAVDDPEVQRTFDLFVETWKELEAKGEEDIMWECRGRWDPLTGEELPEEARLEKDKDYTVRAWQAVVMYLLLDYKFLYE